MKITTVLIILFAFLLGGCASSSDLERRASYHSKACRYYESIGQPQAAGENCQEAQTHRDAAREVLPVLMEIFNRFTEN